MSMLGVDTTIINLRLRSESATKILQDAYGDDFKNNFLKKEDKKLLEMSGIMDKDIVVHDPVFRYEQLRDFLKRLHNDAVTAIGETEAAQKERAVAVDELKHAWAKHGTTLVEAVDAKKPQNAVNKIAKKVMDVTSVSEKLAYDKLDKIVKAKSIEGLREIGGQKLIVAFLAVRSAKQRAGDLATKVPALERKEVALKELVTRFAGEIKVKLKRADFIATHYRANAQKRICIINIRIQRALDNSIAPRVLDSAQKTVSKALGKIRAARSSATFDELGGVAPVL